MGIALAKEIIGKPRCPEKIIVDGLEDAKRRNGGVFLHVEVIFGRPFFLLFDQGITLMAISGYDIAA